MLSRSPLGRAVDRLVYRTVALSTIPAFYALLVNTGVITPGGAA